MTLFLGKFKVDDYVKFISKDNFGTNVPVGAIGKIRQIGSGVDAKIKWDSEKISFSEYSYEYDCMEASECLFDGRIRVGDKVRIDLSKEPKLRYKGTDSIFNISNLSEKSVGIVKEIHWSFTTDSFYKKDSIKNTAQEMLIEWKNPEDPSPDNRFFLYPHGGLVVNVNQYSLFQRSEKQPYVSTFKTIQDWIKEEEGL